MLADLGIQVIARRGLHRSGRRVEQVRMAAVARDAPCQLEQRTCIKGRGLGIAAIRRDHQLVPQEFHDLLRGLGPELQPNGSQLAALFQQLAHDIAEVHIVVHHTLVHRNVGVAGHTEQTLLLHGAGCKDRSGVVGDQLLHKSEAGRLAVLDEKHPLKLAADRHDTVANPLVFGVQLGNIVDVLVVQEGKRMAGVHDLRAEQGQQLTLEVGFPEMLLLLAELGKVHLVVALLRKRRHKMLEVFVALGLQLRHARRDGIDLLRRRHVGDIVGLVGFQQRLVIQRTDTNHEEFIHIAAEDGGKFDALPQGHRFFFGKGQNAAVKIQPAEFAVDEDALRLFFQMDLLLFILRRQVPPSFLSCVEICP